MKKHIENSNWLQKNRYIKKIQNSKIDIKNNNKKPSHADENFIFRDGTLYFSKELERKVLFFMTMAMLLAGIFVKLGIF
jgi:hypothetical protein